MNTSIAFTAELVPGDQIKPGDVVILDRVPCRIIARSTVFLPAGDILPAPAGRSSVRIVTVK